MEIRKHFTCLALCAKHKCASRSASKNRENQKSKRYSFVMAVLILFSVNSYSQNKEIETCHTYLKENGQSPEKYIISKFEQYDYVFLGEYHRIKQDVDLVTSLVPGLYKNGIRNIAVEFYPYSNQAIIDSLLTAKDWDEKTLYHNIGDIAWGYFEYLDLYKTVWEFNQTLQPDQPAFRVVLLSYDYYPCKKGLERFGGWEPDAFHADVFEKEVISKNEKALIHCGMHHAFTTYRQPKRKNPRFGNIINEKYPERTFTIFLHSPWDSKLGLKQVKPVHGVIDDVMDLMGNMAMAFDVKNTVMGTLKAKNTYYAIGYKNFKLEDYCDGYIFLAPYKNMKFVSVDPNFYDEYNLEKLKEFMKCRGVSDKRLQNLTKEIAVEWLTEKPERHFGKLMK